MERPKLRAIPVDTGVFGIVLGVITVIALVIFIPAIILTEANVGRSNAWPVTMGILLLSGIRLSFLVHAGERRLFEFIFWLFAYVFFGLAPTVQLRADEMPTTTKGLDPALDMPTAILALAGILAFAVGFRLVKNSHGTVDANVAPRVVSIPRLAILTGVALLASTYYLSRVGIGVLFSSRAEFGAAENELWPDPSTGALISAVSAFPILVAAHGWWSVAHGSKNSHSVRILAGVLTALSLFLTNPISSARYHFGVVWGSFLGTAGAYKTARRTSITMLGIVGGLLFLFPVADLFRRKDVVAAQRSGFLSEYAGNGDYDAFGQLSNAIFYNATEPFQFAHQLMGSVFFWVPRSIWSNKPSGTGSVLAEFRGYNFTNLSAPIWAEMLLNFGVIGVVIASIAVGALLGRLDRRFMRSEGFGVDAIMASILPFYLLILMRGSLLQATGILVVLVFSIIFIGTKNPPRAKQDWGTRGIHGRLD